MTAQFIAAAFGAVVTAAAAIVAADRVRISLRATGQHRAISASPDMSTLAAAIESGDAEPAGNAWCPECTGRGVHTLHADGTRTCWANGHTTKED